MGARGGRAFAGAVMSQAPILHPRNWWRHNPSHPGLSEASCYLHSFTARLFTWLTTENLPAPVEPEGASLVEHFPQLRPWRMNNWICWPSSVADTSGLSPTLARRARVASSHARCNGRLYWAGTDDAWFARESKSGCHNRFSLFGIARRVKMANLFPQT